MPDNLIIKEVSEQQDAAWQDVEKLFHDMYVYMESHGLMIDLGKDGEGKWVNTIKKSIGRFGVLYISIMGEEITGFAHGSIRLLPDYLGNKKVGVITHIHIAEANRGYGAGRALVHSLEEWFLQQDVHSIELQVLSKNIPAIGFWEKLGYKNELLQCRKMKDNL